MNANKRLKIIAGLCLYAGSLGVLAVLGLDASENRRVNHSLAKKWSNTVTYKEAKNAQEDKRVINVSSRQPNVHNVSVNAVQSGQKTTKEITVTSKEVI